MQHLSQNFCKGELPKNGIVNIFNVKSPNVFLRPTNLRQGQMKFFRSTNRKQSYISEIWPEKGQPGNLD